MAQLKEIYKRLSSGNTKKIILVGERGVGKTWMAKKLSDHAIRKRIFDFSLWIFLRRNYDKMSLLESVARQLSLLVHSEEYEVADDNNEADKEGENKENSENLKKKIHETLAKKRFLLVLDDEGSTMKEEEIMTELKMLMPPDQEDSYIILITRAINSSSHIPEEIHVKLLPLEELSSLLQERIDATIDFARIKNLFDDFIVKKCKSLPAAVSVVAKALNYFGKRDSGVQLLQNALEEADTDENYNVMQLLRSGYDLLPISVLIDFCWQGRHVFRERGSVHYSDLITYWILEGYLGCIDSIEKAYEIGHHVVMELIDCGMLKELEAGYVIMEAPVLNLYDCHHFGFLGKVTLGLATVFDRKWKGFGRITHKDGVVRTLFKDKQGTNLSTLLLDGNHFSGEILTNFLQSKKLQVLALFHPTLKELPSPLSEMPDLYVVVLRGCDFLEKINLTPQLKYLTVLEISGATSLKNIPNDFFKDMPQLQSLNFSKLNIESLPSSLYDLVELRWLILRGCSCLREVGVLSKLVNLEGLDLSDATSLVYLKDKNFRKNLRLQMLNLSKTKVKTLPLLKELGDLTHLVLSDCADLDRLRSIAPLTSLQILDISGAIKFKEFHDQSLENIGSLKILNISNTRIEKLPSNIGNPRHLFLKGCSQLTQLPLMEALQDLEVLDLSGSSQLEEIEEGFFENLTCLQELKLSETKVTSLPSLSNLFNLRELLLSCCESLKKLPELNALTKLEVLDASHCTALTVIPNNSFEHMSRLQMLDLSETKIEILPPLPNPSNLRKLLLKKCTNLKKLPKDITLSKLEELDLSGVSILGEIGADFLEGMNNLRILNLSETLIKGLPAMSNLKNLNVLSLRGCQDLENVPDLDTLTNLEVLDLSATAVSQLQSLGSFRNLRQYHSSVKNFLDLKMTDLLGHNVNQLPCGISNLAQLELLELPRKRKNQGADTIKLENPEEDLNQQQWIISNWPAETQTEYDKHGISVSSTQFLELLEEDPSLWDTSFKQFHFLLRPINQQSKKVNKYVHTNELIFREIFFQARQFGHLTERARSLEIRGFQSYPVGVDVLLGHADVVYLIDNPFINLLSDLHLDNMKEMKICWIERCNGMKSIMDAEKVRYTANSGEQVEEMEILGDNLEILWVSNATNLECIVNGNLQGNIFKNLKFFYLDCCPKLSEVFCSSQQFDNLEVLEIKFCDELETLFEHESVMLPKLQTLHLWALPKLKRVGCMVPNLHSLQVGECPTLVTVLSSSHLPENMEILHVKFCERLGSVFEQSVSESTLHKLHELHMWNLPVMKSIGVELPSLQDFSVRECPNLYKKPVVQTRSSVTNT